MRCNHCDPVLVELLSELLSYPKPEGAGLPTEHESSPVVPMRLRLPIGTLNLIGTTMVFGTPLDVTLSELALETFFPADAETAALQRRVRRRLCGSAASASTTCRFTSFRSLPGERPRAFDTGR